MLEGLISQFAKEKSLTKRETEILFLLTKNITHLKGIAEYLKLSRSTVNNHLNNIYIKTSVNGKAQLLAKCFEYISERVSVPGESIASPKVLLVDDSEDVRLILKDHLEEIGFSVTTTSNLIHARGILEKESIDLILSNINMPELDGFKVIRDVRIKRAKYPMFMRSRLSYKIGQ